ncbi:hypothetical protein LINGRAHAP2_LOCUS5115 [Linum grandiflorum]
MKWYMDEDGLPVAIDLSPVQVQITLRNPTFQFERPPSNESKMISLRDLNLNLHTLQDLCSGIQRENRNNLLLNQIGFMPNEESTLGTGLNHCVLHIRPSSLRRTTTPASRSPPSRPEVLLPHLASRRWSIDLNPPTANIPPSPPLLPKTLDIPASDPLYHLFSQPSSRPPPSSQPPTNTAPSHPYTFIRKTLHTLNSGWLSQASINSQPRGLPAVAVAGNHGGEHGRAYTEGG